MSLPRLDFSALSYNAAQWPLTGKVLLGCALAGLVLAVGEMLYIEPARVRLQEAQALEVVQQRQVAEKNALAASLEDRARQFTLMEEKAAGFLRQLSGESEMPGLLEDIARLAAANGLVVEGVTVLDEHVRSLYVEQPVQIVAIGSYHDLAAFISAMGKLARIVTLHDVALRSEGALLRLEVLARMYRSTSTNGGAGQAVDVASHFVYDAARLRDPFQPPALQVSHVSGRPAQAPDLTRPKGSLETLAVDQFEMVGTLSRGGKTFALLRATSAIYRLAVGDYLGANHGRVTAIHDGSLEVAELFPDEQGAWLERSRTLVLNVNS